jgi:hypothetical protein
LKLGLTTTSRIVPPVSTTTTSSSTPQAEKLQARERPLLVFPLGSTHGAAAAALVAPAPSDVDEVPPSSAQPVVSDAPESTVRRRVRAKRVKRESASAARPRAKTKTKTKRSTR